MWVRVVVAIALCACGAKHPSKSSATCAQVAAHVESLFDSKRDPTHEHARDIAAVFATRCNKDRWPGAVRACVLDTKTLKDPHHCKSMLGPDERTTLDENLVAAEDKQGTRPPARCVEYEALAGKLEACDKLPRATRDAIKAALGKAKGEWSKATPETKAQLGTTCKANIDSLKQSATLCGAT